MDCANGESEHLTRNSTSSVANFRKRGLLLVVLLILSSCLLFAISACTPPSDPIYISAVSILASGSTPVPFSSTNVMVSENTRFQSFFNMHSYYYWDKPSIDPDASGRIEITCPQLLVAFLDANISGRSVYLSIGFENRDTNSLVITPHEIGLILDALAATGPTEGLSVRYPVGAGVKRVPKELPKSSLEAVSYDMNYESFTLPTFNAENRYLKEESLTVAPGEQIELGFRFGSTWKPDDVVSIPVAWPDSGGKYTIQLTLSEEPVGEIASDLRAAIRRTGEDYSVQILVSILVMLAAVFAIDGYRKRKERAAKSTTE